MSASKQVEYNGLIVSYYDEPHIYIANTTSECQYLQLPKDTPLTSVSTFIKYALPKKVDSKEIIKQRRGGWSKSAKSIYKNMTDEEILTLWEKNNSESIDLGKRAHALFESFLIPELNGKPHIVTSYQDSEILTLKYEYAAYQKFRKDHPLLKPVMIETMVYDIEMMMAGTFDALFRNVATNKYVLVDWKRCKKVGTNSEYDTGDEFVVHEKDEGAPNHPCLKGLDGGNYCQYMLQLALYKDMIKTSICDTNRDPRVDKNIPFEIEDCFLINVHPDFKGFYQKIRLLSDFEKSYSEPLLLFEKKTKHNNTIHSTKRKIEQNDTDVTEPQYKKVKR